MVWLFFQALLPMRRCRRAVSERVAFLGWIDQSAASALCAAGDILVLPSHAEGLVMSVLEGLAHGLAVVATPVGAHAEAIKPERSGPLTPPADIAALAAALAIRRFANICDPVSANAFSTYSSEVGRLFGRVGLVEDSAYGRP